jgi:hypothetical protein
MNTFDSFVEAAVKSGLVSRQQMAEAIAAVQVELPSSSADEVRLGRLIQLTIERQLLTAWQCEKLREHKYKGFFQDHYKLLNWIVSGRALTRYVAEDTRTGAIVELIVVQGSYIAVRRDSFIEEGIAH